MHGQQNKKKNGWRKGATWRLGRTWERNVKMDLNEVGWGDFQVSYPLCAVYSHKHMQSKVKHNFECFIVTYLFHGAESFLRS